MVWRYVVGAMLMLLTGCQNHPNGTMARLLVIDEMDTTNVITFYDRYSRAGNTSVANDASLSVRWSGQALEDKTSGFGYFTPEGDEIAYMHRNRDLGQVFAFEGADHKRLKSIVVKTGYGSNVVRRGMYGQKVSIQIFKVSGNAVLNDNGSDSTMSAFHGFPHNRHEIEIPSHRDDFYEGLDFKSVHVFTGFTFPEKTHFGFENNSMDVSPDHDMLKGRLLKFEFPDYPVVTLEPGVSYAFMLMIDEIGVDRGFTLANESFGSYPFGHGIRREGDGRFPPVPFNTEKSFHDDVNYDAVISSRLPEDYQERIKLMPGTNGYPDVCTWRDLFFYVEAF